MIDSNKFELIKRKYGNYASWAIWSDVGDKPKSNIADLSVLDPSKNKKLLEQLKPEVVFVGLNVARVVKPEPFANYHDSRPIAQDYKIRYALKGSPFWGGYMTDIIKGYDEQSSVKVKEYLKTHKTFEEENVKKFREELKDLGSENPTIIAFGNDSFNILTRNFKEYKIINKIIKIPHYSNFISKEKLKEQVKCVLKF
jgi:hypothetical protein